MTFHRAVGFALMLTVGCDPERLERWNPSGAPRRSYPEFQPAPQPVTSGSSEPAVVEVRADVLRLTLWQRYSTLAHERYEGVACWRVYFDCRLGEANTTDIVWSDPTDADLRCEHARATPHRWRRSAGNEWVVPIPQQCRRRGYIEAYIDVLPGMDCRPINAHLAYHSLLGSEEVEHRVVLQCAQTRADAPLR